MQEYSRTQRIEEQLRQEISQIVQRDIKDPRLGMVTVSRVSINRDLTVGKVYISTLGSTIGHDPMLETSLEALNDCAGFVRSLLGKRLRLRTIPAFTFLHDSALEEGDRLSNLISEVAYEEREKPDNPYSDEK